MTARASWRGLNNVPIYGHQRQHKSAPEVNTDQKRNVKTANKLWRFYEKKVSQHENVSRDCPESLEIGREGYTFYSNVGVERNQEVSPGAATDLMRQACVAVGLVRPGQTGLTQGVTD